MLSVRADYVLSSLQLMTDKFAALWRIAAPVHPIRRSNCAESGYCELIRPRKGLTSNNEAGQRAENGVVKTAKAQSLPQNAPILTEVFGPMWLARVKKRCYPFSHDSRNQGAPWPRGTLKEGVTETWVSVSKGRRRHCGLQREISLPCRNKLSQLAFTPNHERMCGNPLSTYPTPRRALNAIQNPSQSNTGNAVCA